MDLRCGSFNSTDPDDETYKSCEDIWDPSDDSWFCPHCHGVCNCSLCLIRVLKHCLPTADPQGKRFHPMLSILRRAKLERGHRYARQLL